MQILNIILMKVTQNIFSILLIVFLSIAVQAHSQAKRATVTKVVIDAGHGGKDPGTVHKTYQEKNITLTLALLLGDLITKNLPDVKVVYTRQTDVYIPLAERGNIANREGADLFISIHVDAVKSSAAHGSSTFVMGVDKSNANLDVAMRENDVVSMEADYTTKYEGYIPGSAESYIIFSLMQYAYLDKSMSFAQTIQKSYKQQTPMVDRGARQAPYLVLWKTAMPSVLTEVGFLSNDADRAFLVSDQGQKKVALSLFNAFSEYKSKVDGGGKFLTLDQSYYGIEKPDDSVATPPAPATKEVTVAKEVSAVKSKVFYAVQISSSKVRIPVNSSRFGVYKGKVKEYKSGAMYKYCVGECASFDQATKEQAKVRGVVKDAFIVGVSSGKIISSGEARKLIGK